MGNHGGWKHRQPGQALVEMLVVIGIFLTLVLGTSNVGQYLLANHTISNAARAAAHQAAIQGGNVAAAEAAAQLVIDAGVGTSYSNATVQVTCARSPCRRYDPITVQVTYADRFWTPSGVFNDFTIIAEATRAAEKDQQ